MLAAILRMGLLAVVVVLFGVAFVTVRQVLNRPLALAAAPVASNSGPPPATGTMIAVTVKPGEPARDVASDLQTKGLIASDVVFLGLLRLNGSGTDFQVGTHEIAAGSSMDTIINELQQPVKPKELRVTFPEGRRDEEDAAVAQEAGIGTSAAFLQLADHPDPAWSYAFLKDKPKAASLEGYLFPDTYLLNASSPTPSDLIKRMLEDFNNRVTPQMQQQIASEKHTLFDTLIIASIVEREAKVASERPLIAGVYWNRLKSNQGLFADPTVQYALGKPGNWWPQLTLDDLKVSSPYNTYANGGLPPGPICNPGLSSIQAAINPQGDYLYFVAKNDGSGEHAFARTLQEHNANRAKYQG